MYKNNNLDYASNLKLIDAITTKQFKQYEITHRKTYSQPDQILIKRQSDRLELLLNQSLQLQMYPCIFKYLKFKVKDLQKPLNFAYEINNNQCQIKIFLSSITDSPNILNNTLQVINKPRFQYTEPPPHIPKFKCEYVYLSLYSDKYVDLKIRVNSGIFHKPQIEKLRMQRLTTPVISFQRESLTSREKEFSQTTQRSAISLHKPISNQSFIKSNKESQIKFKLILDFKIKNTIYKNSILEETMKKKNQMQQEKKQKLLEKSYSHEIIRLESRKQRLIKEIKVSINTINNLWSSILYTALLCKIIKHKYYKRVMRIVIGNKVKVCCRKFMRIMIETIRKKKFSKIDTIYLDSNLIFSIGAKYIKSKAKKRSYLVLNNFLFKFGHSQNGINKIGIFYRNMKMIQQKWRTFKKLEFNYINRNSDQIVEKWGILCREAIQQMSNQQKSIPTSDKRLLNELILDNLNQYKKIYRSMNKLIDKLQGGSTVFRPLTHQIMLDIMTIYIQKKQNKFQ